MPAFTFEKILPPHRHGGSEPQPEKPRGVLDQMIERLAKRRARHALRDKLQRRGDDPSAE